MNNIDIANGIVFQKLGISNETFENRLISQKKMYILQALGTDLGYEYSWYIRGPYSPSLTNYIYNNIDVLSATDFSQYRLLDEVKKNIDIVNSLAKESSKLNLSIPSLYELLASLLYIIRNASSWGVSDKNTLFQKLTQYKPKYTKTDCENGYQVLLERIPNFQEI